MLCTAGGRAPRGLCPEGDPPEGGPAGLSGLPAGSRAPPGGHSGLAQPSCYTDCQAGSWDPGLLGQEIPRCREMRPPPSDWLFGPEHPSIGVPKAVLGLRKRGSRGLCTERGCALLPPAALTWPRTRLAQTGREEPAISFASPDAPGLGRARVGNLPFLPEKPAAPPKAGCRASSWVGLPILSSSSFRGDPVATCLQQKPSWCPGVFAGNALFTQRGPEPSRGARCFLWASRTPRTAAGGKHVGIVRVTAARNAPRPSCGVGFPVSSPRPSLESRR